MNRRDFSLGLLATFGSGILPVSAQLLPRVNGARLNSRMTELGRFGRTPEGGTHRPAYSDADLEARQYVMVLMRDAKLAVSVDAAGNIIGRRAGSNAGLKPLMIGSHIDSVPQGGSYDGQVGSMGAIEVAQALAESNVRLRHPLEVIIFQNEEGGTTGSTAITEGLSEQRLGVVTNSSKTVREGIKFLGGDPDRLATVIRNKGDAAAYVELHIEQGGRLHGEKVNIGVVEGIVGLDWWDVTIDGFANHAGTTPMDKRRDALVAAARYVEAVNRVARSIPGRHVATVGKLQAFPGATNVIPGRVTTSLDVRDLDGAKIKLVFGRIMSEVKQIETATGTKFEFKPTTSSQPALTDTRIRAAIDGAAKGMGLTTMLLPSGAGHDAQEIAKICPIGMIFIPSRDGISHSPKEFSTAEDITNGANVLLHTVLRLDAANLN